MTDSLAAMPSTETTPSLGTRWENKPSNEQHGNSRKALHTAILRLFRARRAGALGTKIGSGDGSSGDPTGQRLTPNGAESNILENSCLC
jgi:hypothetical protein